MIRAHLVPILGDLPINAIQPDDIRAAVTRMERRGLAPKTVRTNYGVLKALFNWAVDNDYIARSPCRGVRLPPIEQPKKPVVSMDDVHRLADAIDPRYRCTILVGALGLRQSEAFGLRVHDIDFRKGTLRVEATINDVSGRLVEGRGKTVTSRREFAVPEFVLDELHAHLDSTGRRGDPDAFVFQAPRGGPLRASTFRTRFYNPALERAGLPGLTFHRLRHSAGHIMRELGVPLEVIQKRLGHRSIRTTADVYGSLPEEVDRRTAQAIEQLADRSRHPNVEADPGNNLGR